MGNEADKKFTWVIKNFTSFQSKKIYSDEFVIGGCKWRLLAYPKGNSVDYLSLFLEVADYKSFEVVNQFPGKVSQLKKANPCWFDQEAFEVGIPKFLLLTKLHDKDGGFLMNGEVKIVVEVDVLEVIGKLDVPEESEEVTQPLKKVKPNDDDGMKETPADWVDVNGFQVFPSQVKSVRCIFKRHPDFASKLCAKNRHLKSTYMNVLLGVIETLCQLPEELSDDDLDEASVAVSYVAKGGFKVDWLEKKLEELKAKKKKVDAGKAWQQRLKDTLEKYNQKCLDLKAFLEKKNSEVLGANVSFSFDDVV